MDDPGYLGKFWVGGHDHYRTIFTILVMDEDDDDFDSGIIMVIKMMIMIRKV